MLEIRYSPYQVLINTASCGDFPLQGFREGILLSLSPKPVDSFRWSLDWGYVDIMPWPELGDKTSADYRCMLEGLGIRRHGDKSPSLRFPDIKSYLERIMTFPKELQKFFRCLLDFQKSAQDIWAMRPQFTDIPSHTLVMDPSSLGDSDPNKVGVALKPKSHVIKIKIRPENLEKTRELMNSWAKNIPSIRWRLDGNASLSVNQASKFFDSLGKNLLQQIEFFEDPFPFNPQDYQHWQKHYCPIAIDWVLNPHQPEFLEHYQQSCFQIYVVKPSRESLPDLILKEKIPFLVTTHLGHYVDWIWSSWCYWIHKDLSFQKKISGLNYWGLS